MDYYLTIVRGLTLLVTLASIFAISVVTILRVMKQAEFLSGRSRALVAVSLSVLFLVALSQFLVGSGDAYHTAGSSTVVSSATRYFLLPGVALGVAAAVLLSQVLLLASRTPATEQPETPAKKPERGLVKAKSPGRPKKKDKPVEKPSKEGVSTAGGVASTGEGLA
jgi:hypothetical protein